MIAAVVVVVAYLAVVVFLLAANYRIHQSPQPEPEPDADAAWLWDQPTDCLTDAAVKARFEEITAGIWTHR